MDSLKNYHNLKDLTGKVFGTFTVIKYVQGVKYKRGKWECSCSCGNVRHLDATALRRQKSCGCLFKKEQSERRKTHGMSNHGKNPNNRLYSIWRTMKVRCDCPNTDGYENYGGRGISVCQEWYSFENFYTWAMSNGYEPHLTIDREINDGNYSPENCRWVTVAQQNRNKRGVIRLENDGVTMCVAEWARELGKGESWIMARAKKGMSIAQIIESIHN